MGAAKYGSGQGGPSAPGSNFSPTRLTRYRGGQEEDDEDVDGDDGEEEEDGDADNGDDKETVLILILQRF